MERKTKGGRAGWPLLNAVNVGGVLVILILLISTNFASRLFDDRADPRPPEIPPNDDLNKKQIQHIEVQMRAGDGFRIIVRVAAESPSTIHVPPKDGDFDFGGLTDELFKIKQAYEARQEIFLAAEDEIPYGKFLKAVAACRDKTVEGAGQKMTYPLFPAVHFMDLPE